MFTNPSTSPRSPLANLGLRPCSKGSHKKKTPEFAAAAMDFDLANKHKKEVGVAGCWDGLLGLFAAHIYIDIDTIVIQ